MDYSLILLYLLVLLLTAVSTEDVHQKNKPLVSFGELTAVSLQDYDELRVVEDIEPDPLNPGGFVVGNRYGLIAISPYLNVSLIAGSVNGAAYRDGVGRNAYFGSVQDILNFNNGSELLIADLKNHCIRKVERSTRRVSTFAGTSKDEGPAVNGTVKAREATLRLPQKIIHVEEENLLYYLLLESVVKHNLTSDEISLVLDGLPPTYSFIIDSTKRYLYISHIQNMGISKVDIVTKENSTVTGDGVPSQTGESRDGKLQDARFKILTDMTWLIQDQVLLVCEHNSRFRVINLVGDQVTSICTGELGEGQAFKVGNVSSCAVYKSYTVNVIDGIIYTASTLGSDGSAQAQIHRLAYSQPICGPPDIREANITYSPVKEIYTHNDTAIYACDSGYDISNSYNSVSCVRGQHNNGTVFGEWEREPPTCVMHGSGIKERETEPQIPMSTPNLARISSTAPFILSFLPILLSYF